MTWLNGPLLALDTETTGTDPESARIVQVCVGMSQRPGHWEPWTRILNPGVPIPTEATDVHGITDARAAEEGMDPREALAHVHLTLSQAAERGVPVVAHNASFDLSLLDRELRRHLDRELPARLIVLDTLCLFRRFDWTTGGRSLGKLAERHGITFPAHDAEADTLAALRILHILASLNDLLPLIPADVLHDAQRLWWVQQQDAAESAALGNGREFVRQDYWPMIPANHAEGNAA